MRSVRQRPANQCQLIDYDSPGAQTTVGACLPAPAFFTWRAAKIAAIFRARYPVDTPITEIGSGLGKNLIVLAHAGHTRLTGLDPTDSAIHAVCEQAQWFGQPWQAARFDLLDPGPAVLGRLAGQVLFTSHVIEQLPGPHPPGPRLPAPGTPGRGHPHRAVRGAARPGPQRGRPGELAGPAGQLRRSRLQGAPGAKAVG
jgi:hypothetical protein